MDNIRKVTQEFLDDHDFLMLVPEFLCVSEGKNPDEMILELANKDLKSFEVMSNTDTKFHGLERSEIKYFNPTILPVKEFPRRYEALKFYIIDTVKQSGESQKIEFNANNFSFEFDEPKVGVPEMVGSKNIKHFRIVRLMQIGDQPKMDVPDPSYFFK